MSLHLVHGRPPPALAPVPAEAAQTSPLVPGARMLDDWPDGAAAGLVMLAPPGAAERAHALGQALRVLAPGARCTILAPKAAGGARLFKELAALGAVDLLDTPRAHHRIVTGAAPLAPQTALWSRTIAASGPRHDPALGLWTWPGVFSWNRVDPGSALLLAHLPPLSGRVADVGCGVGVLARAILTSPAVTALLAVDVDGRAVAMAARNLPDPRVRLVWADARAMPEAPTGLDHVVMNPPFHDAGVEDRGLGAGLIAAAAAMLRPGGRLWLVANRHLPYEEVLRARFSTVTKRAEESGFKVFEAIR
jgi:16S rRNA (guanine1207-N2)-methyltransferase